jgi:cation diffusion facilitator family transporter
MSAQADSLKSVLYALGANLGIAAAKTVAALITGSGAMLAEAIHSFADSANQGLLLWGMRAAKRAPDENHPLGYGKAIYFWSFIVALLLFSVGGLFSINEGWHKLHSEEPVVSPWVAIGVLLFAIVAESLSMRACVVEVNKVRAGRSFWEWFRESRQSELVVIFGEDLAALIGLVFALVAVVLTAITGNVLFDAVGSIAIGVLLVIVAILLSIEIKAMLVGQSADRPVREAIEKFLRDSRGIDQLYHVITLHFGDDIMVAVKARVAEHGSADALCVRINEIEADLKANFPGVKWVFFEPDIAE